jgi:hypothetical protein
LECGGGRVGEEACGGRLTLYGGMAAWSYDLELAGIAEGSHAKTRRRERSSIFQVPQLPKTFCGNEGVLECSGLTELWMGPSALMEKSQAVSSHRSPRNQDPT